MKRLFDIVASGLGLIVLSPLFIVLAIWIKLDSKGPVFYRQVRVGRGNKDFRIYKFRSMRVGADKGSLVTIGGHDPRVTRSGYFIRKFKFDELPQLINVFLGDMSLVGPRPEVRHYVDYWTPEQMHVLDVRPGITDPASIKFRNENELIIMRLSVFVENETRSCSMDFGGITPLYVYRMWNGSVALEDIEATMAEIKFPGR